MPQELHLHLWGALYERTVDHDIKPDVSANQRPRGFKILVIATPIWMGSPISFVKRILERLGAVLSDAHKQGRYPTFGKVAMAGVAVNEEGAHHVTADVYQGSC